ncbi:MAG: hypothetical protein JNL58_11165 [Planctomyces sp.]|nr:hypothetical protein [Planctomyces sp.]
MSSPPDDSQPTSLQPPAPHLSEPGLTPPVPQSQRAGLQRRTAPAVTDDLSDDDDSPNRYEWESRALMAGFGTFFIGAIKNFLLLDATGFYLLLTAVLAGAGTLIVTLIYVSRFQRTRTITKRELVAVAIMLGVTFALFRNATVTQQNWSKFRQRFQQLELQSDDTVEDSDPVQSGGSVPENSLQPEVDSIRSE